MDDKYPEHTKLKKVGRRSQACGEFLDWLRGVKKFHFYVNHEHTDDCYIPATDARGRIRICEISTGGHVPVGYVDATKLLAEYFEIDTEKLEQEKMAILEEFRSTK